MYTFKELQGLVHQKFQEQSIVVPPEDLYEPIEYILSMGGKRLRPILMVMGANLFTNKLDEVWLPALGIEIFHNFTLLHDDVMDNAPIRRNKPTVHKKWNDNVAILSGDAMSIKAYQYIVSCDDHHLRQVLEVFNQTAMEVCQGQQYDMEFETRMEVSQEEYLEMIRLKTAVLLGGSLKIGALLGDASPGDAQLLYDFGVNIGVAFQLQDDLLDVYGDETTFGKRIGGDIVSNKKTYLLIKALELAQGEMQAKLVLHLNRKEFDPDEKIAVVKDIYDKLKVKEYSQKLMEAYMDKGIGCLEQVSVDACKKKELFGLVERLLNRSC